MTENIWIAIATIIASFISALVAAEWQVRRMRAAANPAHTPQKRVRAFVARIIDKVRQYGWTVLAFGAPVVQIVWELALPGDVSDGSLAVILIFTIQLSVQLSVLASLYIVEYLLGRTRG